jgi:RNase P subunit RPR2
MPYLRYCLIALLLVLLSGWLGLVSRLSREPLHGPAQAASPPRPNQAQAVAGGGLRLEPFRFKSNDECEPCHREVFEEWFHDQHALAWFNEPLLPQDPRRTECNNCHAPLPVLEVGIEALPRIRAERFHEGVGCIECHRSHDHVEGPRPSAEAACNPRFNPEFSESLICSSCHAPHSSLEEWTASAWAKKGTTCQACHMPLVDAPAVSGGPIVRRRSHRMLSQRDPAFLARAVELEARVVDGARLEVAVTNSGAGHSVPGEIFNREVFLETQVLDREGKVMKLHRESFKTVQREQRASVPSTQLQAGERRSFAYELGPGRGRARVRLGYKLFVYLPDAQAQTVAEREVGF